MSQDVKRDAGQGDATMLDYRLVLPGLCIVATSYGLARYAYGLFLPIFRTEFALGDAALAYIAAISYASYVLTTIVGIYLSTRLAPRISVLAGGMLAALGMATIALAQTPLVLALGVAIAGVSPGLAYTPFSEIIATLVTPSRQRTIYALINPGTSLGVMLSGPAAIVLGENWRIAWALFALFGLLSTAWCMAILPAVTARAVRPTFAGLEWASLVEGRRARLFLVAFLFGIATSVYWAFSVDLVTRGGQGVSLLPGLVLSAGQFGQVFWTVVGIAGFAGMAAGLVVQRLGIIPAMRLFLLAIALATGLLALATSSIAVILSALLFGATFVMMAAAIGMASLELFRDLPAVGFGSAFLLLSVGQFTGPLLVGLLIDHVTLDALFLASAMFCAMIVLLLPSSIEAN